MIRSRRVAGVSFALLMGVATVATQSIVASAASDDTTTDTSVDGTAAAEGSDGTAAEEASGESRPVVDDRQPDVNGDGKVVIGVISPGDTNDGGYYEAFITAAEAYTEEAGWELTVVDRVNAADGANQARNLCRQGVDMVAIAATENRDAVPVAEEDVCANAVFALFGDFTEQFSDRVAQVTGESDATEYLIGVAVGQILLQQGSTTAGWVGGPELDFSVRAVDFYTQGVLSQVPDAEVLVTYTGSFDDGGKAREAVVAQTSQGATMVYTYLGGATDAAASAVLDGGALAVSPGTDRCDDEDGRFGVSGLFAPGLYFENLLHDFSEGRVAVGTTIQYLVGVDPVPGAKVCDTVENAADIQAIVDETAAGIADGSIVVGDDSESASSEPAGTEG